VSERRERARLQLSMEVAVSVSALLDLYTTFHSLQFAVSRSSAHTYTTTSRLLHLLAGHFQSTPEHLGHLAINICIY